MNCPFKCPLHISVFFNSFFDSRRWKDASVLVLFVCLDYKIRISGIWTKGARAFDIPPCVWTTENRISSQYCLRAATVNGLLWKSVSVQVEVTFLKLWTWSDLFRWMVHAEMKRERDWKASLSVWDDTSDVISWSVRSMIGAFFKPGVLHFKPAKTQASHGATHPSIPFFSSLHHYTHAEGALETHFTWDRRSPMHWYRFTDLLTRWISLSVRERLDNTCYETDLWADTISL